MNCAVNVGLLSLTILMDIVLLGVCEIYKPLQWSSLNPLFQTNGDTSAYKINVHLYSRFNIICQNPANNPVTIKTHILKENMYENIWSVDKKSFETCTVNTTNDKNSRFFECDDPLKLKYHTMIFLPTTNIKGQPEFKLGKDHYFIATSNGSQNSLKSTALGNCHTKNMRFIIYVCKDKNDPSCKAKSPPTNNKPKDPVYAGREAKCLIAPDDPSCKAKGPDPQVDKISNNVTTTRPPTDKNFKDPVAAGRKATCFIAADETVWLILVCTLGMLVLLLVLSHMCLCYRRRRGRRKSRADAEKLSNLIL